MTVFRAATLRTFFFAIHAGAKELTQFNDLILSNRQKWAVPRQFSPVMMILFEIASLPRNIPSHFQ